MDLVLRWRVRVTGLLVAGHVAVVYIMCSQVDALGYGLPAASVNFAIALANGMVAVWQVWLCCGVVWPRDGD